MENYLPTIGLEIHAELDTKTKMFCPCLNDPNEKHPNINICEICMGHPGALPTINKTAVEAVVKTGLALNCKIATTSKFDRKNYFYPDLPKGYQISQYDKPLCSDGYLEIPSEKSERIRIRRIHLEEDTGRLLHQPSTSLIDYNRAGIPLMEMVTEPDIHSAKAARAFAEEFALILKYLAVSKANMEKGELRLEGNISVAPSDNALGVKVEIKNINSFKALEDAINYEIKRQIESLEKGENVVQETRGWDDIKKQTVSQRGKEEAHDYRYFPEPDLPPLLIAAQNHNIDIEVISRSLPELPRQKRERFIKEYWLTPDQVEIFIGNKASADFFEQTVSELRAWEDATGHEGDAGSVAGTKESIRSLVRILANYILSDLAGVMTKMEVGFEELLIKPEDFAEYVVLIHQNKITSRVAKDILPEMVKTGLDPHQIVEEKELTQVYEESELSAIIQEVIAENEKAVADFRKGKMESLQFLIGQVIRKTKGRANPKVIKKLIEGIIKNA